jgi:CNT family concentrative nucleoside transporter
VQEELAGLDLSLDGMAPATHMAEALRLIQAGQPADEAMLAAEKSFASHGQQMNLIVAMLNGLLGWAGDLVGLELSFQIILGWLFAPVSWLIGVPWDQAQAAGALIGTKIVINEFVAFIALVQDQTLNESSKAIVTFALCGFANISSMAILIGGLGAMVPERKSFIARYGMRAILAGVLANLMSASLAGLFLAL